MERAKDVLARHIAPFRPGSPSGNGSESGATALNNEGARAYLGGNSADARRAYEAALAIEPANVTVLNNLGFLLAGEGRFTEAAEYYQRALEIDPLRATTLANLGVTRAALGDVDGAIAALTDAAEAEPGNVLAWDNLAKLMLGQ